MADVKKVKAINPQIVVHGTLEKPYYEISYYDTTDNQWHIGYSSYDLYIVKEYLDNYFEIIEADVEPVKHGHWYNRGGRFRCSVCDTKAYLKDVGGTGGWSHEYIQQKSPYCPNCGAKMENAEAIK